MSKSKFRLSQITDLSERAYKLIMKYVYPSGILIMGEFVYTLEARSEELEEELAWLLKRYEDFYTSEYEGTKGHREMMKRLNKTRILIHGKSNVRT
jgi:hypothetical protein